jgi:DNA-binding LacI/PurR family transcriptional regulator
MREKITMADVAREAGVHVSTVSLALKDDRRLPPQTRERIQSLARELGYRPNPMVSALIAERRQKHSQRFASTLAFLSAYESPKGWQFSSSYTRIFEALGRYADERGYRLENFWLREPKMTSTRLKDIMLNRGIRGILVCPLPGKEDTLDFDFTEFVPVALGNTLLQPVIDHVAVDYFSLVSIATAQLRATGHRRIGFVSSRHIDLRVKHRSKAAYLALRYEVPRMFMKPLIQNEITESSFREWFRMHSPDAIMAASQSEFHIIEGIARRAHLKIPTDFSLVNLDKLVDSSESGVVQNLDEESRAAIELLTTRVERAHFGLPASPQTVLVAGLWEDGWSSCSR